MTMIMKRYPEVPVHDSALGTEARPITNRQMQVLRLSCEGLRLREIAEELGLSPRTVEHHKYQMMARLDVRTSAQLILYAARRGWV